MKLVSKLVMGGMEELSVVFFILFFLMLALLLRLTYLGAYLYFKRF